MKRLKALETENGKLKRLLAERDLEVDIMREVTRRHGPVLASNNISVSIRTINNQVIKMTVTPRAGKAS